MSCSIFPGLGSRFLTVLLYWVEISLACFGWSPIIILFFAGEETSKWVAHLLFEYHLRVSEWANRTRLWLCDNSEFNWQSEISLATLLFVLFILIPIPILFNYRLQINGSTMHKHELHHDSWAAIERKRAKASNPLPGTFSRYLRQKKSSDWSLTYYRIEIQTISSSSDSSFIHSP